MTTSGVFTTPLFILQSNIICVKLCIVLTKEPIRVVFNLYRKIQTYYFCFHTLLKVRVATTPYWRTNVCMPNRNISEHYLPKTGYACLDEKKFSITLQPSGHYADIANSKVTMAKD